MIQKRAVIKNKIAPLVPGDIASRYDAFYLIVPPAFDSIREMFLTKFDELFGPLVSARVFTFEQSKHAKTVVGSERELFISFGCDNVVFGHARARLHVPLPRNAGYGALMAIGYYVIGRLQSQYPPYFKDSLPSYCAKASAVFGHTISPIVELSGRGMKISTPDHGIGRRNQS